MSLIWEGLFNIYEFPVFHELVWLLLVLIEHITKNWIGNISFIEPGLLNGWPKQLKSYISLTNKINDWKVWIQYTDGFNNILGVNMFKPHILYQVPSHNRNEKGPYPPNIILMHRYIFHSHELGVTLCERNCTMLVTSQYAQSKKTCVSLGNFWRQCYFRDQKDQWAFDGTTTGFRVFHISLARNQHSISLCIFTIQRPNIIQHNEISKRLFCTANNINCST